MVQKISQGLPDQTVTMTKSQKNVFGNWCVKDSIKNVLDTIDSVLPSPKKTLHSPTDADIEIDHFEEEEGKKQKYR